ncbi:MAG: type VI secretion system-associated protein TagF [Myxococcales bacterium]
MSSVPLEVGVYGKVGTQADFLRANAGEFSQAGLDLWFQEAMETLRTEGTQLPQACTGFLLAPSGAASTFLGSFAPTADSAGRSFLLAIFAQIGRDAAVRDGSLSLPSMHDGFVRAVGTIVAQSGNLTGPEIVARAQAAAAASTTFDSRPLVLAQEPAQPLIAALGDTPNALAYALRTFISACDQAAKTGPDGRGGVITVDAPAPSLAVRELWIQIARRRLGWRDASPSLLWTEGATGRMLITLGPPGSAALSYLANPRHRASRFWPLRTEVTAAIDQAMNAMTPEQRQQIDRSDVCLGDLVSSFS